MRGRILMVLLATAAAVASSGMEARTTAAQRNPARPRPLPARRKRRHELHSGPPQAARRCRPQTVHTQSVRRSQRRLVQVQPDLRTEDGSHGRRKGAPLGPGRDLPRAHEHGARPPHGVSRADARVQQHPVRTGPVHRAGRRARPRHPGWSAERTGESARSIKGPPVRPESCGSRRRGRSRLWSARNTR